MIFFAIRHLPTDWNQKGLLQGRQDRNIVSPLDIETAALVQRNQLQLIESNVDCVLVSSLQRTQQSAQVYGYNEFIIEPLLDELNFGHYEGQSKCTLMEECGELWLNNPLSLQLGEPLSALQMRVQLFLEKYSKYKCILIFGHGAWLRALTSYCCEQSIKNMNKLEIANNALLKLDVSSELFVNKSHG